MTLRMAAAASPDHGVRARSVGVTRGPCSEPRRSLAHAWRTSRWETTGRAGVAAGRQKRRFPKRFLPFRAPRCRGVPAPGRLDKAEVTGSSPVSPIYATVFNCQVAPACLRSGSTGARPCCWCCCRPRGRCWGRRRRSRGHRTPRRQACGAAWSFAGVRFFAHVYMTRGRAVGPPQRCSTERHWSGAVSVIAADGAAACERDLLSVHRGIVRRCDLRCHLFERPERSGAMVGLPAILSPLSPPSLPS